MAERDNESVVLCEAKLLQHMSQADRRRTGSNNINKNINTY